MNIETVKKTTLCDLGRLQIASSELLNFSVDVVTANGLNHRFRNKIMQKFPEFIEVHDNGAWQKMWGMRNQLVYGYSSIDYALV